MVQAETGAALTKDKPQIRIPESTMPDTFGDCDLFLVKRNVCFPPQSALAANAQNQSSARLFATRIAHKHCLI
jgi:hypothetical protein